jgi:luciferase-like monooxygenase
MKSRAELHQELRERILNFSRVTERRNAGIHEDAFLVGGKMFMHIHGHGHCDIRLSKAIKNEFSRKAKHANTDGRRKQDTPRPS